MTKKETWKSESCDGAFLFLLLHKRICGAPDDFSASETQNNPDFDFLKYTAQTFKRGVQAIANKVKKFEEKNTGLNAAFKSFLAEVLEDKSDYFEAQGEKEEDNDEDFLPEDVEDLTHISADDISESDLLQDKRFEVAVPNQQSPIDTNNIIGGRRIQEKNTDMTPTKSNSNANRNQTAKSTPVSVQNNVLGKKYMTEYPDEGLIGFVHKWRKCHSTSRWF